MPPHHHHHHHHHPSHTASTKALDRHAGHTPETFRNRFLVSLLLTLPILYVSEEVRGLLGLPPLEGASWIPLLLGTLIYLYGGGVFLQGALRELRGRRPGMMTLVALGITVAFAYSLAVELGLKGKPFWWELATLVDVMLLGHFLEMKAILGAGEALRALAKLMPQTAHRLRDGRIEDVPTEALKEGDLILIRPGEQVPADGVVVEGATSMNEAFLTGESRPVAKGVGDEVLAGALNGEGAIVVRVTRTGTSTTLGQIMRLVEEAQVS
ncbi:heavy metal translocating P-type ATPase, partial [Thermus scotoductus]